MKKYWRQILTDWKLNEKGRLVSLPKEWFPRLLARLLDALRPTLKGNIISGFRKCGIVPFNKSAVSDRISRTHDEVLEESCIIKNAVTTVVLDQLNEIRQCLKTATTKNRKKRLNVVPGKSVSLAEFQDASSNSCEYVSQDEPENVQSSENSDDDDVEYPMPPPLPKPHYVTPKRMPSEAAKHIKPGESASGSWQKCDVGKQSRSGRSISLPSRFC
jgi:hypothetical protein